MWPATITVSTDSYTFTGLMPGTSYIYNIRKVCDSNYYSDWCTGTFTTVVMPCDIPDNLTVLSTSGREVEIDWTAEVDTNTWQIHVFNTAFDYTEEVTAHPATITGLQPGTTYHITITSLCGGGIVTSDPSDTLDVTTDDCQIVGDITVTDITKAYAVYERAIMYDWCICNGNYSICQYAKTMLPLFLSGMLKKEVIK